MTDEWCRNNIGARNPYVVTELKKGHRIDWEKKSPDEKTWLLEESLGNTFSKLFDPKHKSGLFPKKTINSVTIPETGSGDAKSCNPNPCPAFDDFLPLPGAATISTSARYDDLIQGCLPDCFFVAALSAFAWAIRAQDKFLENLGHPTSYTFYVPQTDANGNLVVGGTITQDATFSITADIPLIRPYTLVFSRSNDYKEIWPSLYEKAFATWVYCRKNGITPSPTVKPSYLPICQGNPVAALVNITGKPFTSYNTNIMGDGDSYNKIRTQFTANGSIKTQYPTVAWTYETAPGGVSYNNDVIVANHSYTVLGVYPQAAPADLTKTYIVLRNPFGQSKGDPKTGLDTNLPSDAFYKENWGPLGRSLGDTTDGIFALKDPVFRKYFAGFGWVKF
jgi:hypothetical protein